MSLSEKLSETQQESFTELMNPESNWPTELRDRFDSRCTNSSGYQRDLDKEVVSDYIREMVN